MYIGVRSDILNKNFAYQRNGMWCWAASIQMLLNSYGIAVTQESIVRQTFGLDAFGQLPNKPGSWLDMTANLNKKGIDYRGRHYYVESILQPGFPSPHLLYSELTNQHPILISFRSRPRMNHAVLVTAMNVTDDGSNQIVSIVTRDPSPSHQNVSKNGRREWKAIDLAKRTDAHWIIRVHK